MSRLQRCADAFAIAPHAVQDRSLGPDACIHAFALTPSARDARCAMSRYRAPHDAQLPSRTGTCFAIASDFSPMQFQAFVYAVDNQAIGKYDKTTGNLVKMWEGDKKGPFLHLDTAMVKDSKIYAAHSNYPDWPMTSSLEIFDAETMEQWAPAASASSGAR